MNYDHIFEFLNLLFTPCQKKKLIINQMVSELYVAYVNNLGLPQCTSSA